MSLYGNGHVINGTPISVDYWQKRAFPHARLFFLSHYHSDHIIGLTAAWDYPVYTSSTTGQLLTQIIGVKESLVKCLEIGEAHLIAMDLEGQEMLSVTLFDANHCPGSVMFLFQGYFGNILYTGDFRYVPDLLDFSALPEIDILYLDNTYCSPKCVFPKFKYALDQLLERLHCCLRHSKRVYIGLDNLGKEEIFRMIAKETHSTIYVTPDRKKIMSVLGLDELVTCDWEKAKILVVPSNRISSLNIKKWNEEMPTCALLATAKFCGLSFRPYTKQDRIHVVSLSNHSSFDELVEFAKRVRPRAIIPVIGKEARGIFNTNISNRADMSVFSKYLNSDPRQDFTIPKTVESAMSVWSQNCQQSVAVKSRKRRYVAAPARSPKSKSPRVDSQFLNDSSSSDSSLSEVESEKCDDVDENDTDDNSDSCVWEVVHITTVRRDEQ